jgi:hemerythrin-like domain-containing protein
MGEMSMNKAIHGAFRRDLDRFVSALERFTPGDRERAQQLGAAWANFDDQLTHHHEGEHEIAWPALESIGVSKDVIATMDAEHETMAAALADARAAMATFTASASRSDADAALGAMQKLREVTVAHLEHEETELEDVYLSQKDSPQMKAMGRAFGRVSPARGGRFFAWVLDGASIDERAAVTSEVPGPVLSVMGGVFGRSYRKNIAPVWHA